MWFFLILAVSFCGLLTTTAKVIGGGWGDDSGRFSFFSPFPLGTCTATLYSDTILQGDQVFYIVKETGRSWLDDFQGLSQKPQSPSSGVISARIKWGTSENKKCWVSVSSKYFQTDQESSPSPVFCAVCCIMYVYLVWWLREWLWNQKKKILKNKNKTKAWLARFPKTVSLPIHEDNTIAQICKGQETATSSTTFFIWYHTQEDWVTEKVVFNPETLSLNIVCASPYCLYFLRNKSVQKNSLRNLVQCLYTLPLAETSTLESGICKWALPLSKAYCCGSYGEFPLPQSHSPDTCQGTGEWIPQHQAQERDSKSNHSLPPPLCFFLSVENPWPLWPSTQNHSPRLGIVSVWGCKEGW